MESTDFIYTCWGKEQRVLSKNLAILKKDPDKEAVHDLRVAVKKLRAAAILYFLLSKNGFSQDPLKKTEQLFDILGKQRDLEIGLEIIDGLKKDSRRKYPELKDHFLVLLPVAYAWTKNVVRQYKKKELEEIALVLKKEEQLIEPEELKIKITALINTHLANCRNYYKKPHKLRQNLKEIYYWIKMVPETLFSPVAYEKELADVLDDLGNWRNLTVFTVKLKHFRKDHLPETFPEYEAIKMLEADMKEKNEKLLKLALHKTRRLLRKALKKEKA
jgi:CHAD domain-containing protein